jgi:hypothetical protein
VANAANCGSLGACTNGSCANGGTPCGGAGQPCCRGAAGGNLANFCTSAGLGCNADTNHCEACGGGGQPCCAGDTCAAGGCCEQNVGNFPTCVAANTACEGTQGMCVSGGCMSGACGKVGEPCCGGDVQCTSGFANCQMGVCRECGGLGERCCNSGAGDYCGAGYVCQDTGGGAMCAACGASGQRCCPGGLCAGGATCSAMNRCP